MPCSSPPVQSVLAASSGYFFLPLPPVLLLLPPPLPLLVDVLPVVAVPVESVVVSVLQSDDCVEVPDDVVVKVPLVSVAHSSRGVDE